MIQNNLPQILIDQSKDLIWMIDVHFQLVYANRSYLHLMKEINGVEKKLNESIFVEGFGKDYIKKWKAYYERALKGEYFEIEEHYYHPEKNETLYSQITFEPLIDYDDNNKLLAVTCQSRDITRILKQKTEEHQLLDASLDVFCTVNEQGKFVYVSAASEKLWGYKPEELIGTKFRDLIFEEDLSKTDAITAVSFTGVEINSFVNRYKKKDGGIAYNLWSARWDHDTKLRYAVAKDYKEKSEQEGKMLFSEQRFKALVQEGSDLIAIIDPIGNYKYVSPSCTTILGITTQEFIGRNTREFIHPDDFAKAFECLQKLATQKRVELDPIRFQNHKKEWRWMKTVCTNLIDNPVVNGIVINSRDITEEMILKELHRQTSSLAKIGSWEVDFVNQTIYWSNMVHQLHETDPKTFVPTLESAINFYREDFRQMVRLNIDNCFTSDKSFDFEAIIVTAKKKELWVHATGNVEFENGVCKRIYGCFQDIDERKIAEEAIKKVNSNLESVIEGTRIATWEWNVQTGETVFSESWAQIIGYTLAELEPISINTWEKLLHPEDFNELEKVLEKHFTGELPYYEFECRMKHKNGDWIWVLDRGKIKSWSLDHKPLLMFGSHLDIDERKKAEESLIRANERFEKVTEATNDAIWDWDIENQTIYRSKAYERFFGKNAVKSFEVEDFWKKHFHPDELQKNQNSIFEAIQNPFRNRWELEYKIFNELGETLYIIDRGLIIRNHEGKAIRMVGAMTDITEQKLMNVQLSELNKKLQKHTYELERSNEELEQFAFVASHDLQEPLRMISSFMNLLEKKYGDLLDEKGLKYIYFATDGAKRMKNIILDLLEYSRANKSADNTEEVDLNGIITEYKLLRRKLISETNTLITDQNLPILTTFKAAITQVFHCLLDNAIKYSVNDTSPIIEINAIESELEWEFSIKDNGIGIEVEFFNKIFVIFQRLHNMNEYSGTGIGLSITKRHVEFLGGRIWLESVVDKGTIFYFTILKNQIK